MLTSDLEKALSKTICKKLLRTGSELSDTFPCAPQIYLAWALRLLVPFVFFISRTVFFASSPSVVTSKWGKKGDEENRVGSSAPFHLTHVNFHLTHVKNYMRGTTRRLTVMRTGEEN